jgi:hypothetical protein
VATTSRRTMLATSAAGGSPDRNLVSHDGWLEGRVRCVAHWESRYSSCCHASLYMHRSRAHRGRLPRRALTQSSHRDRSSAPRYDTAYSTSPLLVRNVASAPKATSIRMKLLRPWEGRPHASINRPCRRRHRGGVHSARVSDRAHRRGSGRPDRSVSRKAPVVAELWGERNH